MKKLLRVVIMVCLATVTAHAGGRGYEPTWDSLDARETPEWYGDARFGIFIHWGLYSVPAFAPRGTYAEWYWHAKDGLPRKAATAAARSEATRAFHRRVYGDEVTYADFRGRFTCEMFDPEHWATVFKRSGARYVVLTSKHHDGYCLWPNQAASRASAWPGTVSTRGRVATWWAT